MCKYGSDELVLPAPCSDLERPDTAGNTYMPGKVRESQPQHCEGTTLLYRKEVGVRRSGTLFRVTEVLMGSLEGSHAHRAVLLVCVPGPRTFRN